MIDNGTLNLLVNIALIIAVAYLVVINSKNKNRISKIEKLLNDSRDMSEEAEKHLGSLGNIIHELQKEVIKDKEKNLQLEKVSIENTAKRPNVTTDIKDRFPTILRLRREGQEISEISKSMNVSEAEIILLLKVNSLQAT